MQVDAVVAMRSWSHQSSVQRERPAGISATVPRRPAVPPLDAIKGSSLTIYHNYGHVNVWIYHKIDQVAAGRSGMAPWRPSDRRRDPLLTAHKPAVKAEMAGRGAVIVHKFRSKDFLDVTNPDSANVHAYAIKHSNGTVTVVLDNVQIPSGNGATSLQLDLPAPGETSGASTASYAAADIYTCSGSGT